MHTHARTMLISTHIRPSAAARTASVFSMTTGAHAVAADRLVGGGRGTGGVTALKRRARLSVFFAPSSRSVFPSRTVPHTLLTSRDSGPCPLSRLFAIHPLKTLYPVLKTEPINVLSKKCTSLQRFDGESVTEVTTGEKERFVIIKESFVILSEALKKEFCN